MPEVPNNVALGRSTSPCTSRPVRRRRVCGQPFGEAGQVAHQFERNSNRGVEPAENAHQSSHTR